MAKVKLPDKSAIPLFFLPNKWSKLRMIFSAPPLRIKDTPITEASAIKIPTLALVFPKAVASRFPKETLAKAFAADSDIPLLSANAIIISGVVNKAVTKAANNKEIAACNFNRIIQNMTIAVPIRMIKIGLIES